MSQSEFLVKRNYNNYDTTPEEDLAMTDKICKYVFSQLSKKDSDLSFSESSKEVIADAKSQFERTVQTRSRNSSAAGTALLMSKPVPPCSLSNSTLRRYFGSTIH